MVSDETLRRIVAQINLQDELTGCMIGATINNQSRVLQVGNPASPNYGRVLVIIEESSDDITQVSIAPGSSPGAPTITPSSTSATQPPAAISNRSKLWPELIGAGLNCGMAVWSGVVVLGGTAAEVPSAGSSSVLVVLGYVGFVASAGQCTNGVVRSYQTMFNPDDDSLSRWDSKAWYSWGSLIVDGVGVATSLPSMAKGLAGVLKVLERRGGLVAADKLILMNRAERQAAVFKALQKAGSNPADRLAVEEAMKDSGLTESEIARSRTRGLGSIDNADRVMTAITDSTARKLTDGLKSVLQGSVTVSISATPASMTGSASGSVNALILHVMGRDN